MIVTQLESWKWEHAVDIDHKTCVVIGHAVTENALEFRVIKIDLLRAAFKGSFSLLVKVKLCNNLLTGRVLINAITLLVEVQCYETG